MLKKIHYIDAELQRRNEVRWRQFSRHGGALIPQTQFQDPKLKYQMLYISGIFDKFECQAPPART